MHETDSISSIRHVQVPNEFKCPMTLELMNELVATVDGQVYERHAMHQWAAQKTCIATSQLDMHDLARDEHILYKGSPC